jgi:hypothetical protein
MGRNPLRPCARFASILAYLDRCATFGLFGTSSIIEGEAVKRNRLYLFQILEIVRSALDFMLEVSYNQKGCYNMRVSQQLTQIKSLAIS